MFESAMVSAGWEQLVELQRVNIGRKEKAQNDGLDY